MQRGCLPLGLFEVDPADVLRVEVDAPAGGKAATAN